MVEVLHNPLGILSISLASDFFPDCKWHHLSQYLLLENMQGPKLGHLNVDESCVAQAVCEAFGSEARIHAYYVNCIFGAHSSHGRGVCSCLNLDMPDFDHSPWRPYLLCGLNGWVEVGKDEKWTAEGDGGELWLVCKSLKNHIKNKELNVIK